MPSSRLKIVTVLFVLALVVLGIYYFVEFRAPGSANAEVQRFILPLGTSPDDIAGRLKTAGLIRTTLAYDVARFLIPGTIRFGGYKLSPGMSVWQIVRTLTQSPYMQWVVVPEGLRKEETAEQLTAALSWNTSTTQAFLSAYATLGSQYKEGYYFPSTYLIPVDEDGTAVARRMVNTFNEKFAPLYSAFLKDNVRPETAIKIASLVQREAAGASDMPLIAGIIWNRLLQGMKLDIDATLQYAQGKVGDAWWAPIHGPTARKLVSPYNTYLNKGLPPTPISNPGLNALNAVLSPEKTACLYYLHDANRQIHCAKTLQEHEANIRKYL